MLILATMVGTPYAQKLPASLAGIIPAKPAGKIAFIRNGDVWIMNADGSNQESVCEVKNADGRLSWSPDGRKIAFTRTGKLEYTQPAESSGGGKRLYDIFLVLLDSADVGKKLWWNRITFDLGGRDPEWSADGKLLYITLDKNANTVNAEFLNYQICTVVPEMFAKPELLRRDWQNANEFLMAPSVSPTGDIAVTHMYGDSKAAKEQRAIKPQGLTILPKGNYMKSMDSLKITTRKMLNCLAPCWSPDGKWLAYVNTDAGREGVYLTTRDLSPSYLVFSPPAGVSLYVMSPSFSPDSKWLTFSTNDGSIYTCDIMGNGLKKLTGPGPDKFPAWSKGAVHPYTPPTPKKK